MKRFLFSLLLVACTHISYAQTPIDSVFRGYIYNAEYQVYIKMDFYKNNVKVPMQEIYGELPGYFGAKRDSRLWLISSAKITNKKTAKLSITNDYGSEDLSATLSYNYDGTYTLKQGDGSRMKIVVNRKWVKLPNEIKFTR